MLALDNLKTSPSSLLSDEELTILIAEELPRWKAACDHPEGECVILSQRAFSKSASEMLLLGAAIKYAGTAGKDVTVTAGSEDAQSGLPVDQ